MYCPERELCGLSMRDALFVRSTHVLVCPRGSLGLVCTVHCGMLLWRLSLGFVLYRHNVCVSCVEFNFSVCLGESVHGKQVSVNSGRDDCVRDGKCSVIGRD